MDSEKTHSALRVFALAGGISLLLASSAGAQKIGTSVSGEVTPATQDLDVELYRLQDRVLVERVTTNLSGRFGFDAIRAGDYLLRVTNRAGTTLGEDLVTYNGFPTEVKLRLRVEQREMPVSGTISVARLQHKVPKDAKKEFDNAVRASDKHDPEAAIEHLKQAIRIDPDFMEAHNNLAAKLLHAGRAQEAIWHLRKAVELDPGSPEAFSNLALALMEIGDNASAEQAARRAAQMAPDSPKARYVLGVALARVGNNEEAFHYLSGVADAVPKARLTAAVVLSRLGRKQEAASEVRTYIAEAGPAPADREKLEKWLAQLDGRAGAPAAAAGASQ